MQSCLYRRILGDAFDALPTVLQRFHSQPGGGVANGYVWVRRGRGWLRRTVCSLMRLPREGESVRLRLQVRAAQDSERWIRHFDGLRLETRQWIRDGLLMDSLHSPDKRAITFLRILAFPA